MELSLRGLYYMIGMLMVATLTYYLGTHKIEYYKSQQFVNNHPTVDVIEKRLNCLAMNIYKEAGHEPFEGKVAVAQVTLNRSNDPRFPNDICQVVYQKNVIMEKVVCQFSWYCDSAARSRPIHNDAYKESYEVAKKVLLEGFRLAVLKDALYFHADYVKPNWKHERVAKIGSHIFYNEKVKI
jgi:spore germination cell wall hydrolase CwlJ-like protein